jgi:hypothetical protein
MNTSELALLFVALAVIAAVLGGLGVFGLGTDSRALDGRGIPAEGTGRSLTS